MKKDKRVVAAHKNGLGDYKISMSIRSQVDMSGIMDLVQEMFEQSELYSLVKYNKPYFSVKRIDSGEEISQGYYDEEPEKPTYNTTPSKPYTYPCQSCTKVNEKCIPTDFEGGGCGKCPKYEDRVWANILKDKEPEKDRYITNKELAMWLSQGKGLAMDKGTGRKSTSYDYWEEDKTVDYMNIRVRKWNDEDWHEPTYHYCFGEE